MIARMPTMHAAHHQAIQARHWPALEPSPETEAHSIDALRQQASQCRRCPLWSEATQTVFGEGSDNAELVFVGEQPGDQEDLQGRPFVGPAGKIFDAVLGEAGIERTAVYVTNAVKHFKFEPRGKRRIHSKPNAGEVQACRWWLAQEVTLLKPKPY
jgi:uracil-DNA glycosylase family protein